jgi:hypothetical protein
MNPGVIDMSRKRFVPARLAMHEETPFPDAAAAWFWFMHSQKARWDGARFERGLADAVRPCEPDDIYRCARHLVDRGRIRAAHFKVLLRFGVLDRSPDPHQPDEVLPSRLWEEAVDALTTELRGKGIVE